ncbi:oxygenase MpaB family protein [Sphingobium sp.]|uniref:oxygenase MpaB family protein n=1 Tax=Sphingobium sp. TaxID=1912891 RepID=UPI002CC7E361|nr:oxygenase MpaB family protein [Sphingobium sp.]HUD93692.1 oxygenase MpaB family protein [Sphingobium sp.]
MSEGNGTSNPVKRVIRQQVVAMFNDSGRGEAPIVRSRNALLAPTSVAWRVHGDVASMMAGGIASLLLQMLHPGVLAGVWDHSNFRTDMRGRLRRTARFIATTTYADQSEGKAMIRRVRAVHDGVRGHLPDGTEYNANDPTLLAWVHVTETRSFLDGWIRYGEPWMSHADQDQYFAEMASIGGALGAEPLPRTRSEADRLIAGMRPALRADARTAEVARLILHPVATNRLAAVPGRLAGQAGVDLLPRWALAMHGLSSSPLRTPLVRAGTLGVAQALRWAFR